MTFGANNDGAAQLVNIKKKTIIIKIEDSTHFLTLLIEHSPEVNLIGIIEMNSPIGQPLYLKNGEDIMRR